MRKQLIDRNNFISIPLRGLNGEYSTLVTIQDAEKVLQYSDWYVDRRASGVNRQTLYVTRKERFTDPVTGRRRRRTIYLHRFLMDAPT
ncbi:MAG: hypothetical protein EOO38_28555, partial [Cytophagaceae bacterium]